MVTCVYLYCQYEQEHYSNPNPDSPNHLLHLLTLLTIQHLWDLNNALSAVLLC